MMFNRIRTYAIMSTDNSHRCESGVLMQSHKCESDYNLGVEKPKKNFADFFEARLHLLGINQQELIAIARVSPNNLTKFKNSDPDDPEGMEKNRRDAIADAMGFRGFDDMRSAWSNDDVGRGLFLPPRMEPDAPRVKVDDMVAELTRLSWMNRNQRRTELLDKLDARTLSILAMRFCEQIAFIEASRSAKKPN